MFWISGNLDEAFGWASAAARRPRRQIPSATHASGALDTGRQADL